MTPEYLSRIRAIYEEALELDAADREAFLAEKCGGDAAVLRDSKLLLAAQKNVPLWLNSPLLGSPPGFDRDVEALPKMEGRMLSGYKLLRLIGRGGMGSVYLAERSDGAFHKQVAIKLVQPGVNGINIPARFQQEREILASLDHPGIARLLDAATTEEGLPYFVMEFVDGLPIDRWCDEHHLNVTERVELFRRVCSAVQYAHQRLVVHRDLKPANILVTPSGDVKLRDFGIAKLLRPLPGGDDTTRTQMGVMTPGYASPEQVNGAGLTTLTDVYSLGVILYELLTGHKPYHSLRSAIREIAKTLAEEEPTRPSEIVAITEETLTPEAVSQVREGDPSRLRKRLEGDLDCIVLTALRKEPVRRYSSVEALGEDLANHLESRPVAAREDSVWYLGSRFVRRHWEGVVAGTLILLSLCAGVISTLWATRIILGSSAPKAMSGRALMAPEMLLFSFVGVAGFGVAAYLSRAKLRRTVSCLAAGVAFAICWMVKLRIDYALGWWRSAFPETPNPLQLFAVPLMLIALTFGVGVLFLGAWRAHRRFGWPGQIVMLVGFSLYFAVRDRFWWQDLMRMMVINNGIVPIVGDAAMFVVVIAIGESVMRLIGGAAGKDTLSRSPRKRIFK